MEHTKLIAMRNDLGLGHKGDILLTTQERVDNNQEPIAKDIIDEEHAKELVRRWNAFEKDGLVDELRTALKALMAAPETLPPDNEFDKEQRDYRNRCMTRIDEARKLGKAAIAKAT